jgi:signal transduction histidine kinase
MVLQVNGKEKRMKWTRGRKLSLIVAGANVLIAVAGIILRHSQVTGALFSFFFLAWSLWFIWFPERVGNLSIFLGRLIASSWFPDPRFDLSLVSFAGWVLLVTVVPAITIFDP